VNSKKEQVHRIISQIRGFRFCGPSDDPDEITNVTSGFRYLTVQLKRITAPLLPDTIARRLETIDVEFNNIYSAYDAKAEIDAMLPDIEQVLDNLDDEAVGTATGSWLVDPSLISRLEGATSSTYDLSVLVRICKEINSSYAHGNLIATALLMRGVLNYVPPVFGHKTFAQVVADIGRSLKDSFNHLEQGLRKVADFHTHRLISDADLYPFRAQVEPFKPQFELLLQEVIRKIERG
jgi:hypothetical protein